MTSIKLLDVSLEYPIYNAASLSVRQAIFEKLGGQVVDHNKNIYVKALDSISIDINEGDRVGLIGHNGAGKTSLLRIMSKIYPPTFGKIEIEGTISALTDVSLGMDLESTGHQNIIFRCVFMGLTFREARELAPSIAEFSELGSYLDLPVRTYSTGMFLRLAFAISTSITPDILILDEMIGAGDAAFQARALARIDQLLNTSKVLVISSHDMGIVAKYCTKVVWLDKGQMKMVGQPSEVIDAYLKSL